MTSDIWEMYLPSNESDQAISFATFLVVTFSSLARILGECSTIHSPFMLFFFFLVEISSRTLNALFRPGSVNSGSSSWDDCGACSLISCV